MKRLFKMFRPEDPNGTKVYTTTPEKIPELLAERLLPSKASPIVVHEILEENLESKEVACYSELPDDSRVRIDLGLCNPKVLRNDGRT